MIATERIRIQCVRNPVDCADSLCPDPHDPVFEFSWRLPYGSKMTLLIPVTLEDFADAPLRIMEYVREMFLAGVGGAGVLWTPREVVPV